MMTNDPSQIRARLVSILEGAEARLKQKVKDLPENLEVKRLKKALREHDSLQAYLAEHPLIAAIKPIGTDPEPRPRRKREAVTE